MFDLPIIDTHLHLWDIERLHYPWLADAPAINRSHRPADYRAAAAGMPITKMVFVQCEVDFAQYRQEVEWVTEQAAVEPRLAGIVAWAPLEKGDWARDELATLCENPLLRGIRRIIQFEADPQFCLQPDFVRGIQSLADFDLHFELCLKGDEQFGNTLELVRQCPHVRFVLDHIGKPFIKEGIMLPWADYLRDLAALPNTWCKMSGLANEAKWNAWQPADLRPYIDTVMETFGFDRVMFGGDWPVVTLASTYRRWFDTLTEALSGCSRAETSKLFHDNAEAFYRI